jgi:hypothetical protein
MTTREITLDSAAFLDSTHARLPGLERDDVKLIIERFLACSYDEMGKAPRLLDGQEMHGIVGHLLPAHFGRKDALAPRVIDVLRAYLDHLAEAAVISHAFELRNALETTAEEFERAVATGAVAHHAPQRAQKPFVHQAAKTGRNDPCPCGSGKKFKQCCAKLAS